MRILKLNFDGSCWPNPNGVAAYGYLIKENDKLVKNGHGVISVGPATSNNYAEFHALYQGLRGCASLLKVGEEATIYVFGDSQFVIDLITGRKRATSNKIYYKEYAKAQEFSNALKKHGIKIIYTWIAREDNTEADILSKAHENKNENNIENSIDNSSNL